MANYKQYCGNGIYTTNKKLHWGVYITTISGYYELWGFVGGGKEGSQLWVKFGSPTIDNTSFSNQEGVYAVGTDVFLGRIQTDQVSSGATFSAVCSGGSEGQNGTSQGTIGNVRYIAEFVTDGLKSPAPLVTTYNSITRRWSSLIPSSPIPTKENDWGNGYNITFNSGSGATAAYTQYHAKLIYSYTFRVWEDQYGNTYTPRAYITLNKNRLTMQSQWNVTETQSGVPLPMAYKSGYKLKGWTENSSGSGTLVEDGFIPEQDMTLYAVWEADPPKVKTKVNSTWTESSVKIKNGSEWVSTVGVSTL